MKKCRYFIPPIPCWIIACAAMALTSCSFHKKLAEQKMEATTGIDLEAFNRNLHIAEELATDDKIAWISTDSILAERISLLDSLDSTWFVCKADNKHYAYYGRYSAEEQQYYPKYVFVSTDDSTISKIPPEPDSTTSLYAKMVTTGTRYFKTIVDSLQLDIHYNHYIRKAPGGRCIMWFFPAGYANYCAQGIEIRLTIDSASGELSGYNVDGALLRYFELDKKTKPVELDNSWSDTPSVGNIFFVLRNYYNFNDMKIINRNSISRMVYAPENDKWTWEHLPR